MSEPQFDEAKMDSFQLSDAELDKLNELTQQFIANVQHEFGSRTTQALINLIGSQLSHKIAQAGEDSFYIIETVNGWFRVVALDYGGLPLRITFDDELAAKITQPKRDE